MIGLGVCRLLFPAHELAAALLSACLACAVQPSMPTPVMLWPYTAVNHGMQYACCGSTLRCSTASGHQHPTLPHHAGVEICGALKNVLAIAAGIVEGLELGHNALAALIAQGCAEIRWLAEKLGAKPATMSGLSGLGDIMLTCYGDLSRNRSVGVRLGRGERLEDILASSSQVGGGCGSRQQRCAPFALQPCRTDRTPPLAC